MEDSTSASDAPATRARPTARDRVPCSHDRPAPFKSYLVNPAILYSLYAGFTRFMKKDLPAGVILYGLADRRLLAHPDAKAEANFKERVQNCTYGPR